MAAAGKSVGVGIIGFGTIGTGTVRVVREHAESITARLGAELRLVRVADLDTTRDRGIRLPTGVLIRDAHSLINSPEVEIVVELMGGIEPALTFVSAALAAGKSVVTANKALLSAHGPALARTAEKAGLGLGFEASVGGGIPIVRVLREALAGDRNTEVYGIVNGTSNYILTEMTAGNGEFAEVLARAQTMGLAEADPSYDVDGLDSVHKLVILVALAFGKRIRPEAVYAEGIRSISGVDIAYAREFGYTIKLLAVARDTPDGVEARVHPSMVPNSHLLSQVRGPFNALCLRGRALGTSLYYGQGAGMMPTATAVVADLIDAARSRATGTACRAPYGQPAAGLRHVVVVPMARTMHEHYIRFQCADKPGVLASISSILAKAGISIATVTQHGVSRQEPVALVMRTHRTSEAQMSRALGRIGRLPELRAKPVVIRVEETLGEDAAARKE